MSAETAKTPAEAAPAAEKQTNCLSCTKLLKKLKQYYRDGKYYCTKKCWRSHIKKAAEPQEEK